MLAVPLDKNTHVPDLFAYSTTQKPRKRDKKRYLMSKKNKSKGGKATEKAVEETTETAAATTFSQLQSEQIERLRDAFELIDKDNDGDLTVDDIKSTYKSIGKEVSDEDVKRMLEGSDEVGKIGFQSYLSIMSREFAQLPNNSEIKRALQIFSHDMEVNSDELKQNLITVGMKEDEISSVLSSFESERMNGEKMFMGSAFVSHVSF